MPQRLFLHWAKLNDACTLQFIYATPYQSCNVCFRRTRHMLWLTAGKERKASVWSQYFNKGTCISSEGFNKSLCRNVCSRLRLVHPMLIASSRHLPVTALSCLYLQHASRTNCCSSFSLIYAWLKCASQLACGNMWTSTLPQGCCTFSSSIIRTFDWHITRAKYLAPVYRRLGNRRVCWPHSRAVHVGSLFNVPDSYKSPVPNSTFVHECWRFSQFIG